MWNILQNDVCLSAIVRAFMRQEPSVNLLSYNKVCDKFNIDEFGLWIMDF